MEDMGAAGGHAFISYVREDADRIDELQELLQAAGVQVWRDTADLLPGEDWRMAIRRAISEGSLVFLACFSRNSASRDKSFQNEELVLAVEQLRQRQPDEPWLIPVRFDDCPIPNRDIGAGRTLASIQRADLFGLRRDQEASRLVESVQRILNGKTSPKFAGGRRVSASEQVVVDIGSISGPSAWIRVAEVRFTLSNFLPSAVKVPSIVLRTVRRRPSVKIATSLAAGPVDEYFLFARIEPGENANELLSQHFVLRPAETDGFFLKIDAPEGCEYEFQLECSWKVIGESTLKITRSPSLTIEFPWYTTQGLLTALEGLRSAGDADADR